MIQTKGNVKNVKCDVESEEKMKRIIAIACVLLAIMLSVPVSAADAPKTEVLPAATSSSAGLLRILQENGVRTDGIENLYVNGLEEPSNSTENIEEQAEDIGAIIVEYAPDTDGLCETTICVLVDENGIALTGEEVYNLGLCSSLQYSCDGVVTASFTQYMLQDTIGSETYVNPRSVTVKATSSSVKHIEAAYAIHGDMYRYSGTTVTPISGRTNLNEGLSISVGMLATGTAPTVGTSYTQSGPASNNYCLFPYTATNRQVLKLTAEGGTVINGFSVVYYDANMNPHTCYLA